jgi:mono/diheme cytochrome c family protein
MRETRVTGLVLLAAGVLAAVLLVGALYAWDATARAAEAALRPQPVSPLAVATPGRSVPLVSSTPAAPAPSTSTGPLPVGDAAAGQAVFASQCNACHPGANAGIGPALYGPQVAARYPDDASQAAVIRQGKGGMPAFAPTQVSDADLANLLAYLHGLGSGAIAPEPTPTPRPRQRGS